MKMVTYLKKTRVFNKLSELNSVLSEFSLYIDEVIDPDRLFDRHDVLFEINYYSNSFGAH